MTAIWTDGPMGLEELVERLGPAQQWGAATIKTLVTRLLKKKALASKREGGRAVYSALVQREDYLLSESQGLLDRLFGGQLAPLVAHFANHRALSEQDVERLKRLLDEYERDRS